MSLKRWTLCLLRGHRWARTPYPGSEGAGYFIRCMSCGFENHDAAMPGRPSGCCSASSSRVQSNHRASFHG